MPGYPTRKLLFGGPDIRTNALALILAYVLPERSACVAEMSRKLLDSFLHFSRCALPDSTVIVAVELRGRFGSSPLRMRLGSRGESTVGKLSEAYTLSMEAVDASLGKFQLGRHQH